MKDLINQLSQREKKLLYFLFCFLLSVVMWLWIIEPGIQKSQKYETEYQNKLTHYSQKQSELSHIQTAKEQLNIKKVSLQNIIQKYPSVLCHEKIDQLITTKILLCGLNPLSMQIGDDADASFQINKKSIATHSIQQTTVQLKVEGSWIQMNHLIDEFEQMNGIEITAFQSQHLQNNETSQLSATITLTLYMAG